MDHRILALLFITIAALAHCQSVCSFSDGTYEYLLVGNQLFKNKLSDLSAVAQVTIPADSPECPLNSPKIDPTNTYGYLTEVKNEKIFKVRLSDLHITTLISIAGPGYLSSLIVDVDYIYPIKTNECENVTIYKVSVSDGTIVGSKNQAGFITVSGLLDSNTNNKIGLFYTGSCNGAEQRFDRLDLNQFQYQTAIELPVPSAFQTCVVASNNNVYCFISGNVSMYQINGNSFDLVNSVYLVDNSNGFYMPMIFEVDRYVADTLHFSLRSCSYACTPANYYQFSLSPFALRYSIPQLPNSKNDYNPFKSEGIFQRSWNAANNYLVNVYNDRDNNDAICEGVYDLRSRNYIKLCRGGSTAAPTSTIVSDGTTPAPTTSAPSSTMAPTASPTSKAPSSTISSAGTTMVPTSGSTKAPASSPTTTATKAPVMDLSGNNNARVSNNASQLATVAGFLTVLLSLASM
jgi:hypothetical protein